MKIVRDAFPLPIAVVFVTVVVAVCHEEKPSESINNFSPHHRLLHPVPRTQMPFDTVIYYGFRAKQKKKVNP